MVSVAVKEMDITTLRLMVSRMLQSRASISRPWLLEGEIMERLMVLDLISQPIHTTVKRHLKVSAEAIPEIHF